ncbi:glycoside hydrolase family 31 protein [Halothermothrix orenii]|uniref:Alpha-glucosidase n=1 Tax=Halothermothrix orenii (strain H 168 / OCM 544 / DSM 9562) TaxID=373903 RepID=B8CZD8_HALOH|nr:TIM-barrel domain-containing protein [Halothermothrix orenii]ACL70657.1 Alpha-glucosidase [Halothermothrix orenii H 168]
MNSEVIMDKGPEKSGSKSYFILNEILDYCRKDNRISFKLKKGEVVLEFLTADIVRVVMGKRDKASLETTCAVVDHNLAYSDFTINETEKVLNIETDRLIVRVNRHKFGLGFYDKEGNLINRDYSRRALGWSGNEVRAWKEVKPGERFYGLGEKTGFLDKRGKKYTMWNSDVFEAHVESTDPLYKSIPFLVGFNKGKTYGIYFDNTYKSHFDLASGNKDYYSFWAEGGKMDYYFIYGPDLKEVISKYTLLTGRMPLPPKWSLGYHQSRYSYHPDSEVKRIARTLRKKDIPCDVIHLDIHYMDGYRVFTWNEEEFPCPGEMISDLSEEGFKIVNIIDPGVKVDPEYEVYREGMREDYFCKYLDGRPFVGKVWPGQTVFPDFTCQKVREWWGDLHKKYVDQGVKGIWNDMNEPSVFNETSTMDLNVVHENDGDMGTHRRFHNVYGLLENKATYQGLKKHLQERPFILSRAGFAGIQRYAAVWTGDNRSFWEHLKLAVPMLMNLGMSGVTFAGTDVGGFTGDSNGELLTRWTQLGAFMPLFRNHCTIGALDQEPWSFGEKYEAIIRKYIKLRYRLLPYTYGLFYRASQEGLPVMRPLVMEYPFDPRTYNISDQYLYGDSIMIAPVYEPDRKERLVYLPEGIWFDFWTGEKYEGGKNIIAKAPLDTLPVYIKAGSIIPLTESVNYVGEKENSDLELNIYLSSEVEEDSYQLYEDDGYSFDYQNGKYSLVEFKYNYSDNGLTFNINPFKTGYKLPYPDYILNFKNLTREPSSIMVDGSELNDYVYDDQRGELRLKVNKKARKIKVNL